jgi:hypothetical protein
MAVHTIGEVAGARVATALGRAGQKLPVLAAQRRPAVVPERKSIGAEEPSCRPAPMRQDEELVRWSTG